MTQTETNQPKSKWPRYLLVASLGVNLLFAGLMAGGALRGGGPPDRIKLGREVASLGLRPYYPALPSAHQQLLQQDIQASRDKFKVGRKTMRKHLKALAAALRTTPYNPQLVEDVLNQQKNDIEGNIGLGIDILVNRLSDLSDEERNLIADKLERPRRPDRKPPDQ